MFQCPIDYVKENLIFASDKSCWAVFEVEGFNYDMLSAESKIGILNRLTLLISNVVDEAKFMIIPVMQDLDTHFSKLEKGLDKNDPLYEYAVGYARATKDYLQKQSGGAKMSDYKTFLAVKLQKEGETVLARQVKDIFDFLFRALKTDVNALAGLDSKDILQTRVDDFEKMAADILRDQSRRISLIPAGSGTVWWLLRRAVFRGLPEDTHMFARREREYGLYAKKVNLAGREYLRPRKREVLNLFSGAMRKKRRHLEFSHENSTSYQTFLVITGIPEELSFPDCEWIYFLQQMNRQAEIYIHIRNTEHREAIRKIDLQRRQANSQLENIENANAEIPEDLSRSKDEIDALEAELKENRSPMATVSVTICLAAGSEAEMEEKAQMVRKEYEDINFVVERPLADQFELYCHTLPPVSFTVSDFMMKLTPRALASGIIGATRELGDHAGGYIGTTGLEKKNLFIDMRLACLSNTSASTTFYGNLGVGKSFNANLLTFLHIIYGAYGLIIDPKGERTHWPEAMPMMDGLINLVTLSADPQYRGMLDPFNIFKNDISEASELAINLLSELFKLKPKDLEYTALLDAIHKIKTDTNPSMERLSGILQGFDKTDQLYQPAQMLARQIRLLQDSGMSQLLIGNGTEAAVDLNNRLNILQIQNLKLPSPDTQKDDYTQEEVISTVLMMVMTAFTRKFVHSHKNSFKIVLFDESWMLGKTVEGEKLMSYVARMSRSLYASLILNGHSVTDLPNEGIRNSITYKFCFKTGNTAEAERMLDFLKIEKTKANVDLIMGLGNAQCLFQDLAGHVGVIKFDAVFQDIIDIFSTTPVEKSTLSQEPEPPQSVLFDTDNPAPDAPEDPDRDAEEDIAAFVLAGGLDIEED